MPDNIVIAAEARTPGPKGASRALRRSGRVPAILYGGDEAPAALSLGTTQLSRATQKAGFMNSICMLEISGKQVRTLPRAPQRDPLTGTILHMDFLRLSRDSTVDVEVPMRFINEETSPGLKRGGVLNVVRHTIELRCPVDSMPDMIEADLDGLDIGSSIHISHMRLPEGVVPTITDRDFTIATIVAPAAVRGREEEEEEEAAAAAAAAAAAEGEEGTPEDGEKPDGDAKDKDADKGKDK